MSNFNNQTIIDEVVKRIKRSDFVHQIKSYLKSQGLNETEIDAYYEKGKEEMINQKMAKLPRQNKLIFGICVVGLITVILVFAWILPQNGWLKTTFLAILGSFLCFVLIVLSIHFFNSWNPKVIQRKLEKKNEKAIFIALGIAIVPAFVLFFLFSSLFEQGADNLLRETMISTTGYVKDGFSNITSAGSTTQITIEFQTNSGQTITVYRDLSDRDFDQYYLDQEIPVVYSSLNPYHYKLLIDDASVETFTGVKNRAIMPEDLIALFDIPEEQMATELNAISFGWERSSEMDNAWTNSSRLEDLIVGDNYIEFITTNEMLSSYPRTLEKMGYKKIGKNVSGEFTSLMEETTYESSDYLITLVTYIGEEAYANSAVVMKR